MSSITIDSSRVEQVPFLRTLGLEELVVGEGEASVKLSFDPERHANGIGVAHGGVLCSLLDVVMGYSAFNWARRPGPIVTVSQNVNFLGVMKGRIVATGRVLHGGTSMVFCSGEITDVDGVPIATGQGVFKKLTLRT